MSQLVKRRKVGGGRERSEVNQCVQGEQRQPLLNELQSVHNVNMSTTPATWQSFQRRILEDAARYAETTSSDLDESTWFALDDPAFKNRTARFDTLIIHQMVEKFNAQFPPVDDMNGSWKSRLDAQREILFARIVRYMNRFFCCLSDGTTQPTLIEEYRSFDEYKIGHPKTQFITMTLSGFRNRCSGFKLKHVNMCVGKWKKYDLLRDVWNHPLRRQADGITCRPSSVAGIEFNSPSEQLRANSLATETPKFNTFRWLNITKEESVRDDVGVQPLLDHIRIFICGSDLAAYEYFLDWIASTCAQQPGKLTKVAILLCDVELSIEHTLRYFLRTILGDEYCLVPHSLRDITGRYQTREFRTNCLTFLNERYGDKRTVKRVKPLITGTHRKFKVKFLPEERIVNTSNYILTSNKEQCARLEANGIPCLVLSDGRSWYTDEEYEQLLQIDEQLRRIDPRHFAHVLHHRDISNFNPQNIPKTAY